MAKAKNTQPKAEQQNSSEENQQSNDMVSLGGLWVNRDKNGEIYFSGYLGNAKLLIFRNKKKEQDNQPDYYMNLVNKPRPQSASADDLEKELGDDIPF